MNTITCAGTQLIAAGNLTGPLTSYSYCLVVPEDTVLAIMGGQINPLTLRTLDEARRQATARINVDAGHSRVKYFTNIPGQELTYVEKQSEQKAYDAIVAAGGTPVSTDYPLCNAEAGATGYTLAEVITQVRTAAAQMSTIGAQIEALRRGAIVQSQNATTLDAIDAINPVFP